METSILFRIKKKTTREVILDFCNEITFYDQYGKERNTELKHVRDYNIKVIFESDFKHAGKRIRVMDVIDDISLYIVEGYIWRC